MRAPRTGHAPLSLIALVAGLAGCGEPPPVEAPLQTTIPSVMRKDLRQYPGQPWGLAYNPADRLLHVPIGWMGSSGHVLLNHQLDRIDVVPNPNAPEFMGVPALGFFANGDRLSTDNDGGGCAHRTDGEGQVAAVFTDEEAEPGTFQWGLASVDRGRDVVYCPKYEFGYRKVIPYLHTFDKEGNLLDVRFVDVKAFAPGVVAAHPWQDRLYLVGSLEVVVTTLELDYIGRFLLEGVTTATGAVVDDSGTLLHITDQGGREIRSYEVAAFEPEPEPLFALPAPGPDAPAP